MEHPRLLRIRRLSFEDHKTRWKYYRWIMLITFAYGWLNNLVLGRPEREVTWEAVGVLCLLTAFFYGAYCARSHASLPRLTRNVEGRRLSSLSRRPFFGRAAGIAATVFLVAANRIPFGVLEAAIVEKRLRMLSVGNLDVTKLETAGEILISSQRSGLKVDPSVVAEFTRKAFEASTENKNVANLAWATAVGYLGYRSSLTTLPTSVPPIESHRLTPEQESQYAFYTLPYPPGFHPSKDMQIRLSNVIVPIEYAAVMEPIGANVNKNIGEAPEYIYWIHATGLIDGMHMRNAVFIASHIIYNGGPLILENVYFINCTFELKVSRNARRLGTSLVAAMPATFRAS